jgi:hypothetical protein
MVPGMETNGLIKLFGITAVVAGIDLAVRACCEPCSFKLRV